MRLAWIAVVGALSVGAAQAQYCTDVRFSVRYVGSGQVYPGVFRVDPVSLPQVAAFVTFVNESDEQRSFILHDDLTLQYGPPGDIRRSIENWTREFYLEPGETLRDSLYCAFNVDGWAQNGSVREGRIWAEVPQRGETIGYPYRIEVVRTPELSTWALLACSGLFGVASYRRRRKS